MADFENPFGLEEQEQHRLWTISDALQKRLRELFSFKWKVIMESAHHTELLYKALAVLEEQLAKITTLKANHQCNKQQLGLNTTNVPASPKDKFGDKVNVASIDDSSHHS